MSLPADGQFDVGKVLRICRRRRLEDHPGRPAGNQDGVADRQKLEDDANSHGDVRAVGSSADGRVLAAVGSNGGIHISTDSGASWPLPGRWPSTLVGLGERLGGRQQGDGGRRGGYIYIGTRDNGNWTWTKTSPKTNEETGNWVGVALSRDGSTIVAVDRGGDVYIWTRGWTGGGLTQPWWAVAISADGSKLVAVEAESPPHLHSTDSGLNWTARASHRIAVSGLLGRRQQAGGGGARRPDLLHRLDHPGQRRLDQRHLVRRHAN